jgi:hypothetical protein
MVVTSDSVENGSSSACLPEERKPSPLVHQRKSPPSENRPELKNPPSVDDVMDNVINHEFDSNPLSPVAETCDHESPIKPSTRVVIKMYPGSILGLSSPSQRVADDATNLTLSQTKSILVSNGQFHGFLRVDRKKWPDGICRDPSIQFVDAEPPSAYVGNPDIDTIDNASKFVSLFLFFIFT